MFAIFKREVRSFFTSPIGYLIVGSFLLLNGLFLWVFKGEYNIFDYGFADLSNFFLLAPWIFIFLVPANMVSPNVRERVGGVLGDLNHQNHAQWTYLEEYLRFKKKSRAKFPNMVEVMMI